MHHRHRYGSFAAAFVAVVIIITMPGWGFPPSYGEEGEPEIVFSRARYSPFDEVHVLVSYQQANSDPDRVETLDASLITSSMQKTGEAVQELVFTEVSADSDLFGAVIRLTPDPDIWDGDIVVQRDDDLIVQVRTSDEEEVLTNRVDVDFFVSGVRLTEPTYNITDEARIIVIDPDENRHPDTIDTLQVRIWSGVDRGGLLVTLRETGDRTGIFMEILTFTLDEESTGTRLRVAEGDVMTVKYTDRTLPAPAKLSDDGVETVEVEELFASAGIGYLVPPLERAVASELELLDGSGRAVDVEEVPVGQRVHFQSEIVNSQNKKQGFTYIVQIKDEAEDVVVLLSWITAELPPRESFNASQSWLPAAGGVFSVEAFVWESIDAPVSLSPVRSMMITVSE